jgi:hypothetical protein
MNDQPDLNPQPVPGPADLRASTEPPAPPTAAVSPLSLTAPWPGAFTAFNLAVNAVKKNWQPAVVYAVVCGLLAVVSLAFPIKNLAWDGGRFKFASDYEVLASLIFLLAMPTYYLAAADGKVISLGRFMRFDLQRYLCLLAGSIIAGVVAVASALLFLVPLIWTLPWLVMVSFPIVDRKLGPLKGYKETIRLTEGHVDKVWGIIGVTFLLSLGMFLLSSIPVIGSILSAFIGVVSGIMSAMLYRWLRQNVSATVPVN